MGNRKRLKRPTSNSRSQEVEVCNECGKSVKRGSGRFANRVRDFNSVSERKEMGKPFPHGAFMCAECEAKIYD